MVLLEFAVKFPGGDNSPSPVAEVVVARSVLEAWMSISQTRS